MPGNYDDDLHAHALQEGGFICPLSLEITGNPGPAQSLEPKGLGGLSQHDSLPGEGLENNPSGIDLLDSICCRLTEDAPVCGTDPLNGRPNIFRMYQRSGTVMNCHDLDPLIGDGLNATTDGVLPARPPLDAANAIPLRL